jgi:hypothetical protein
VAFILAIARGNHRRRLRVVKRFVELGGDVNIQTTTASPRCCTAAASASVPIIQYLIDVSAGPGAHDRQNDRQFGSSNEPLLPGTTPLGPFLTFCRTMPSSLRGRRRADGGLMKARGIPHTIECAAGHHHLTGQRARTEGRDPAEILRAAGAIGRQMDGLLSGGLRTKVSL